MNFWNFVLIGIALAMDAFAVTVAKTLCDCQMEKKRTILMILLFGFFQGFMPFLGWMAGTRFEQYITAIDHWLAFILLSMVGINMIKESLEEQDETDCSSDLKTLLLLAVATSIDALAVGITFAFLSVNIYEAVLVISIITTFICTFGWFIGKKGGAFLKDKAGIAGGVILISIGLKILIEHLFFQ